MGHTNQHGLPQYQRLRVIVQFMLLCHHFLRPGGQASPAQHTVTETSKGGELESVSQMGMELAPRAWFFTELCTMVQFLKPVVYTTLVKTCNQTILIEHHISLHWAMTTTIKYGALLLFILNKSATTIRKSEIKQCSPSKTLLIIQSFCPNSCNWLSQLCPSCSQHVKVTERQLC